MSINSGDVQTLTTALLSVPERARFQAGPPPKFGLSICRRFGTDRAKQTPPLEIQIACPPGRTRELVVENDVEQRTVDL
jgi:hypothetical protein